MKPTSSARGNFLDYLKTEKKSGKPQDVKVTIQNALERARDRGRKTIFYAGQNDWAAGMLPRIIGGSENPFPYLHRLHSTRLTI